MGADVKYYVEVEIVRTEWRESYGVTTEDALANVSLSHKERVTGVVITPNQLKGET